MKRKSKQIVLPPSAFRYPLNLTPFYLTGGIRKTKCLVRICKIFFKPMVKYFSLMVERSQVCFAKIQSQTSVPGDWLLQHFIGELLLFYSLFHSSSKTFEKKSGSESGFFQIMKYDANIHSHNKILMSVQLGFLIHKTFLFCPFMNLVFIKFMICKGRGQNCK